MIILNDNILQADYEVVEPWRGFDGADGEANDQTRKVIVPEQFRLDVEALCKYACLQSLSEGTNIQMSLQEALRVVPRQRRRIDSYNSLIQYLRDEMNVTLIIHSQKSKRNG